MQLVSVGWTRRTADSMLWLSPAKRPAKAVAVNLQGPGYGITSSSGGIGNPHRCAHSVRVQAQQFLGQVVKNLRGLAFRPLWVTPT